jgi:hypothetical protein
MGRIQKLAKINAADCALTDEMTTKYSKYEHSQPLEAAVPLPTPDEPDDDLKGMLDWHDEFAARPIA